MSRDNDYILVNQCLQGNKKAFEELVEKYHKAVFNAAYRILNDVENASDVTQSVFLKIYDNLNQYKQRFKFFSWLYKITVNESINVLRQRKQKQEIDTETISPEKNPEEVYRDIELSEKIQNAIMKLNLDYRLVIILYHFHELSYDEISYVLDVPVKTIKSRLFTARKLLRDILIKEGLTYDR